MKIFTIPTINPDIFAFCLYFYGRDKRRTGERHFVEHLMLNSNATFPKDQLRLEIEKLADASAFSPGTGAEYVCLSGSYLKRDADRVVEILNTILNEASFRPDEIEKERRIIQEEYSSSIDDLFRQCFISMSELLRTDLTVIGSQQDIDDMTRDDLVAAYQRLVNTESAELYLHNDGGAMRDLRLADRPGYNEQIRPEGCYEIDNPNISSTFVTKLYDEPLSIRSRLLAQYFGSMNASLFRKLREEMGVCYMVGANDTFFGKRLAPWFCTLAITSENGHEIAAALGEHFVVDRPDVYACIAKTFERQYAVARTDIDVRLEMEQDAVTYGVPFEELGTIPSWEEFQAYAESVKRKPLATIIVNGTKQEDE